MGMQYSTIYCNILQREREKNTTPYIVLGYLGAFLRQQVEKAKVSQAASTLLNKVLESWTAWPVEGTLVELVASGKSYPEPS